MAISTVADIVRTHAEERADRPMITYEGRVTTFAAMHERSSCVARGLAAEGVGDQDRIAFIDKNGPEFFEVLFGAGKLNAVNVAVNWRLAPAEMAYIVNDAEAKVLFVGTEFLGHVDKIADQLETVRKIVVVGDDPRHEAYEAWVGRQAADDPGTPSGPDDVAVQLYTSGTTGLPKGVMLTNDNLFHMFPVASARWRFGPDSVNLVCMPLFHIAGSGWGLLGMWNGCHSVMLRDVDPVAILRVVPEHGVSNALFVPAVLQFLLMTPGVHETDFSSLHTIVYGASPITDKVLLESMATFGSDFLQVYGLTETTGAFTQLDPADHDPENRPELLRSCGKPWEGAEMRIVDPDTGADVEPGGVGEVWVRSRQVMKGYWKQPEETARALLPDGWFRTGDAGYAKDGYLFLHDRVKDMIVSGGENIYPAEVENALMSHPGVADVAVVGVPSERWGETVKAVVVPAAGTEVRPEELIGYARERLAHYKCPTSVDFAEALPRNPSGKLLKRQIREPYWEGVERRIH